MSEKKEKLTQDEFATLAQKAKEIAAMPEGEEKKRALQIYNQAYNIVLQEAELPVEQQSILHDIILPTLDYPGGLTRALLGEAVAQVADPDLGKAKENLLNAVIPYGKPAPAYSEYRERIGVGGPGPSLADVPGMNKFLDKGSMFDFTAGGMTDFGLSMATDPAILLKGLKGLIAGGQALKNAGKTAATLKAEAAARAAAGPTKMERIGKGVESFIDPRAALGEALYRSRFKNADRATKAAGKQPFSETYIKNVRPSLTRGGITSEGLADDVSDIVANREAAIDNLHVEGTYPGVEQPFQPNAMPPTRTAGDVLSAMDSAVPDVQSPGLSGPTRESINEIKDEFRQAALSNPGARKLYQERMAEAGSPNAWITDENGNIVMQNVDGPPIVKMGTPEFIPDEEIGGVMTKYMYKGKEVPPYDISVRMGWPGVEKVQIPIGRPTTRMKPNIILEPPTSEFTWGPPPSKDPLNVVQPSYNAKELRKVARTYQQKAAENRRYTRTGPTQVKSRQDVKDLGTTRVLGDLQHKVGMRARDLEMELLDEVQPGAGGDVFRQYKDVASTLEGAPYIDNPWKGAGGTSSSRGRSFMGSGSPIAKFAADTAQQSVGALQTLGGKIMLDPVSLMLLQPAARYQIQEQQTRRARENPYNQIRKVTE